LESLSNSNQEERRDFLKRYLDILPEDELKAVLGAVSHAKRRRKNIRKCEPSFGDVSVPVSVPVPSPPRGWWTKWKKSEIFSIDIEKVEIPLPSGFRKKYKQAAATVSIVDFYGNLILDEKIKYTPGEFRVNPHNKTGTNLIIII
jgi:hypothetical protein